MIKLIYLTIIILFSSCLVREPLTKYEEWVIIDKTDYGGYKYRIMMQKNNSTKEVHTYQYYYERYNLGDTIKFEKQ